MSLLKKFAKDTAIYGIAAILPKIVNVLLVKLHTGILLPNAYSENTKFYVYAVYFNVLLTYGIETAFFRFFTKLKHDSKVVQTAFTSILISSALFLSVFLLFANPISDFLQIRKSFYIILIGILILDTLVVVPYAYLRVMNRPVKFAFFRIFNISIYALLNLVFLLLIPYLIRKNIFVNDELINAYSKPPKVIYIFIANLIASALTFLLFIPILKNFKLSVDKRILKKMLGYGLPIMIAGLAYATNENIDKLLLERMLDQNTMGIYAATYKIGVFMSLFVTAFRLGAEPFFFSQSKEKNAKEQYAKIMLWFTILGSIFLVGIVVFLDIIAKILIGNDIYLQALGIVPIILTAYLLFGIYHNLSVWYKLTDRTRFAMYLSVFGAIITIIFNLVLIPKIGYMASAWATLAAYGSMTVLSYALSKKYYNVPYQTGKIIAYLVLSSALGMLIFKYYYHNYPIKILILGLFLSLIYFIERKEINQIIKRSN